MAKLKNFWQNFTLPQQLDNDYHRRNYLTRVIVGSLFIVIIPVFIITMLGSQFWGWFNNEDVVVSTLMFLTISSSAWLAYVKRERYSRLLLILTIYLLGIFYTYKAGLSSEHVLFFVLVILLSYTLLAIKARSIFLILCLVSPILVETIRGTNTPDVINQISFTVLGFYAMIILFVGYFTDMLNTAIDTATTYSKKLDQQFRVARQRATEADMLRKAGMYISESLDLQETVNRILDELKDVVDHDSASVLLLRNGDSLEIVGGHGWQDPSTVVGLRFPVPGDNPNTRVVQEGKPHILGNAAEHYPTFNQEPHNHIKSWLGVPLKVDDKVIGMMAIDSSNENHFSEENIRIVSSFADHVAVAIDNAQLYQLANQAIQKRVVLYDVSQQILTFKTDHDQVLEATYNAVKRLMPCFAFMIATGEQQSEEINATFIQNEHSEPKRVQIKTSGDIIEHVFCEGKTMLDNYISGQEDIVQHVEMNAPVHSVLAVPMKSGGRVIGLMASFCKHDDAFTSDDKELLELLAAYAAIAIDNAQLLAEVGKLAITDALTRLPNRRAFDTELDKEVSRAVRYGHPISLLMLDIDDFKVLNDTQGHLVGDEHLQMIAELIRSNLRETDTAYRYGGEEFTLLLPNTDLQGAVNLAERIRTSVEASSPDGKRRPGFTISVGAAEMPLQAMTAMELLRAADDAMFTAKNMGKNKTCTAHN